MNLVLLQVRRFSASFQSFLCCLPFQVSIVTFTCTGECLMLYLALNWLRIHILGHNLVHYAIHSDRNIDSPFKSKTVVFKVINVKLSKIKYIIDSLAFFILRNIVIYAFTVQLFIVTYILSHEIEIILYNCLKNVFKYFLPLQYVLFCERSSRIKSEYLISFSSLCFYIFNESSG